MLLQPVNFFEKGRHQCFTNKHGPSLNYVICQKLPERPADMANKHISLKLLWPLHYTYLALLCEGVKLAKRFSFFP